MINIEGSRSFDLHRLRRSQFASSAGVYEDSRPGCSLEVFEILGEHGGLRFGSRVLQIGPVIRWAAGNFVDVHA